MNAPTTDVRTNFLKSISPLLNSRFLAQLRHLYFILLLAACTMTVNGTPVNPPSETGGPGDTGAVVRVIDGDTIDVALGGKTVRVRYVGMNTPESDEVCFQEATNANAALVQGKTVRLVKDVSETDRYGRLLRYVYVGDVFVNLELVREGFAEVVSYPPDTAYFETFKALEIEAANAGRGCHPTGIFNDGSYTR